MPLYPYIKILYISHFPYSLCFVLKAQHSGMKKAVLKVDCDKQSNFYWLHIRRFKTCANQRVCANLQFIICKKNLISRPIHFGGKFVSKAKFEQGPSLYYVRVKGRVGGIAKYLLFLTGVSRWVVLDHPYVRKKRRVA